MANSTESAAIRQGRGKWSAPGVPHKGWTCIDTDDLEDDHKTCEMCESSAIRYAHTMTHPDFKGPLVVGVICAGNMEQHLQRARDRERQVRNRTSRRERWPHVKWKETGKGNERRDEKGYRCVVMNWPEGWQLKLLILRENRWISGRKRFTTIEAAKLAAFDYIEQNPLPTPDDADVY